MEQYPPLLQECQNCAYVRSSIHFAIDDWVICGIRDCYVEPTDWCNLFDLNPTVIPHELEEYLDQHPKLFYENDDDGLLPGDKWLRPGCVVEV